MNGPPGGVDASNQSSAFNIYCDLNGEQLSPMPSNINNFSFIIYQYQFFPFVIPQIAGNTLTVDWTGGANWQCDVRYNGFNTGGSLGTSTSSPITTVALPTDVATMNNAHITFTNLGGGHTTPPQNIRVYLTKHQAKINAGQQLDPDYISMLNAGGGSLRFMDWMLTVNSTMPNSFATIPPSNSLFWGQRNGSGFAGMPLSVIAETCIRSNKHPHFCIPANIISPHVCDITGMTNANPAHITTLGPNPFSNGDLCIANSVSGGTTGSRGFSPSSYASSTFTSTAHGMVNGYPLRMGLNASGAGDGSTYPTGVKVGQCQYACNVTANTFQLANTQAAALAGTNLTLSGSMVGTINVYLSANFNTYTVANATSTGFDLSGPGSDMSTWNAFGTAGPDTSIGNFASPIDLTFLATQVGLIAAYFRDNLPTNIVPIYEYSNEIWNIGTRNFFVVNAQSIPFGESQIVTSAYIQTAVMKAIRDTYSANKARYRTLLSVVPYEDDLTNILIGVNDYLTANAPTLTVTDIFTTVLSGNSYQGTSYWPDGYPSLAPITCTFGASTINITDPAGGHPQSGTLGMPIKLNTGGGGTLPSGLTAGVLGTGTYDQNSNSNSQFPKGTISGTTLTASVVTGAILAGSGVASPGTTVGTKIVAQLTSAFTPLPTFTGTIVGTTLTVTGSPTVVANGNWLITGAGIVAGTYVMSGSDPTYTVNISQNVGPITITQALGKQDGTYQIDTSQTVSTPEPMVTGPLWTKGSGQIYWLVGTGPNWGLATSPGGSPLSFTTAGVTGTNTAIQCGPDVVQFLIDQSIANNISSPGTYPTKYSYYNQAIADDILDARWTGNFNQFGASGPPDKLFCINAQIAWYNYIYTNWTAPGKLLAGMGQTTYEGGNNNPPNINFPIFNDATWRDFYYQQEYSAPTGNNQSQNVTLAKAVPGGGVDHISQFLELNSFNWAVQAGSFGARLYIGDNNPRWLGVVTANGL